MSTVDTPVGRPKRAAALKRNYKEVEEDEEFEDREEARPKKKQKRQPAQPKAKAVPALQGMAVDTEEISPSTDPVPAKPRDRKGKGKGRKKKTLSLLPTMPFDIQVEILKYLGPIDLVRISRVCKPLAETLRDDDVQHIWRNAIAAEGAPPPPNNWTPHRWSELLFMHSCQGRYCHGEVKGIQLVDYYTRRRLCCACRLKMYIPEEIVMEKRDELLDGVDPNLVMELTPSTPIAPNTLSWGGWRRRRAECSTRSWWARNDLRKVANEMRGKHGTALETYKAERRARLNEMHELALRCSQWKSLQEARSLQENNRLRYERRNEISRRLKAKGFSEDEIRYAMKAKVVERPAALTERSWKSVSQKLEERITAYRENPPSDSGPEVIDNDHSYDAYW